MKLRSHGTFWVFIKRTEKNNKCTSLLKKEEEEEEDEEEEKADENYELEQRVEIDNTRGRRTKTGAAA